MISHVLTGMGLISKALEPFAPHRRQSEVAETDSIDPEWLSWCQRWRKTSTLRPRTKQSQYYRLLVVGRWLKTAHPEISRPDQWTRPLAAEYLAFVTTLRAGRLVDDPRGVRSDKLLTASSRYSHLMALRCIFKDLLLWDWIPYRFDPKPIFRLPRSVANTRSPSPRIIAEDVWAKLLWAGLNLEIEDLSRSKNELGEAAGPRYPLALVRALALVWLFAGLRRDEIARLRLGCVRW